VLRPDVLLLQTSRGGRRRALEGARRHRRRLITAPAWAVTNDTIGTTMPARHSNLSMLVVTAGDR
jgi:hypothetical protein